MTQLPSASSLKGGQENGASLALSNQTTFAGTVGGIVYIATQVNAGSDARLVRTTPASYGPGFPWCDNLLFASGIPAVRLDFATPITAFGTDAIGNITGGFDITLTLCGGATLLGSVTWGSTAGWQGTTGVAFAGQQSAIAFNRVEIASPVFGFAMNQFAIGPVAAVPEPATSGQLGWNWLAWYRAHAAAWVAAEAGAAVSRDCFTTHPRPRRASHPPYQAP